MREVRNLPHGWLGEEHSGQREKLVQRPKGRCVPGLSKISKDTNVAGGVRASESNRWGPRDYKGGNGGVTMGNHVLGGYNLFKLGHFWEWGRTQLVRTIAMKWWEVADSGYIFKGRTYQSSGIRKRECVFNGEWPQDNWYEQLEG